ncbi:MarR family winged helix-turn-helix transcriptional regulator [Fibrella aquatilis]|uniref:Winged helix DNA-binding protein n=1 Tax=Fibrella aquatilis TaxID=2817059 RepID=A0A939G8U9_9BACT|nr:winged helix DNA-binding protein [Fibrella aquatilis]MBO0932267.1 winged helix DNA-binding protein [Fibrella aquatilis]
MDKTVELVTRWAAFAARNPQANLDDFYRYELLEQQHNKPQGDIADGIVPSETNLLLIKLLSRIDRIYTTYAEAAFEGTGIKQVDEFLFLNAIAHLQEPRKTDVITHTITRLSSGLLIIDRLKHAGYVAEYENTADKRSKRLMLTPAGSAVLQRCYDRADELGRLFFSDLSDDDMRLCIHMLKGVEIKFAQLWPSHKGKSFDVIKQELLAAAPA